MADVLRDSGVRVFETPGWKTRAYGQWGGFDHPPTHVMVHHTASKTSVAADLAYIINSKLSPIGNIYLARDGVAWLVAAGQAVTNGKGHDSWGGGVPDNAMNHYSIAIEAANDGVGEKWPTIQMDAYIQMCAALCKAYNIPVNHVRAHAEWSPGRKIDPAGPSYWSPDTRTWDMTKFRNDVQHLIDHNPVIVEDNMQILNPPMRIIDTRTTNNKLSAGEIRTINLGVIGKAAFVNITAVQPQAAGFITAWGAGNRPNTSALNYQPGNAIANAVPVPVTNGAIQIYSSQATHVVIDLYGVWP